MATNVLLDGSYQTDFVRRYYVKKALETTYAENHLMENAKKTSLPANSGNVVYFHKLKPFTDALNRVVGGATPTQRDLTSSGVS